MIAEGAERGVLGLYLAVPDAWVRWPTTVDDYGRQEHADIFVAMERVAGRGLPTDFITVMGELRRCGSQILGSFVGELAVEAPGTGLGLVSELTEARQRRALASLGQTLSAAALEPMADPVETFDQAVEMGHRIIRQASRTDAPETIEHERAWAVACEAGAAPEAPVRTGFTDLDKILERLPRGELTVVAARPGVGKSAFVGQVAHENARRGRHVLVCSAEMTARQLIERWKSQQTGIPLEQIRRGALSAADWQRASVPLPSMRICDQPAMTTQTVIDVAARVSSGKPLDLIVIDHLHHLSDRPDGESRYEQIGRMVNRLKALAKQSEAVVLLVCQLNRQAADGEPTMAHLRDAGTIEEYANVILLLHQPPETQNLAVVRVEKHRNGPTGLIRLGWNGERTQFTDLEWRNS